MAELTGIPIPSINWKTNNLPEVFRKFKQTCEFIFDGPLSEKDEAIKVQYLMLWVGEDGRDIREGWNLTNDEKKKLGTHWTKFGEYVKPKSSFRVRRFQLRAIRQEQGESIDSFMTRAKVIAAECEYTATDEQLLDTLISGVNNEEIQRKLVAKDKTLTLDQAVTMVRSFEATRAQMSDIQDTRKSDVHYVARHSGKGRQSRPETRETTPSKTQPSTGQCWNCGRGHPRDAKCPAFGSKCNFCLKDNHWEQMCFAKQNTQQGAGSAKRRQAPHATKAKGVHAVASSGNSDTKQDVDEMTQDVDDFFLGSVDVECDDRHISTPSTTSSTIDGITIETIFKEGQRDQAFANVHVHTGNKKTSVQCKIDTGAQSNVMPLRVYKKLFPQLVSEGHIYGLTQTNIKLRAYGGTEIKQYGMCTLQCSHRDKVNRIQFHITEAMGYTMLGLTSSVQLGLVTLNCKKTDKCTQCNDQSEICAVHNSQKVTTDNNCGDPKEEILETYADCFQGVGLFPGEYHIELRPDAEPVIHPPRRIPESLREPLKTELQRMIDLDIIEKVDVPTDWVSSLVYVTKPNGELRICLDPCDLNKSIRREHHYTPTLDDVLPRLANARKFSILDARSGYWNVKLDDESKLLTTFNTPFGRYAFRRLPFGLNSAQDVFQKKVDQTFEGLPGVIGIVDDIVVYGKDDAEHDANLIRLMDRTREVGLRLNPNKCKIRQEEIKFFGHIITGNGIKPDPDKIAAIAQMPAPQSVEELQTLLGMANYLARFIPSLATTTAPLRDLTKKDVDFLWNHEHTNAFNKLKDEIITAKGLSYFDPAKPTTIQTDASTRGLGATLMQDGQPVGYASKSLTDTETRYCNIEREMLAIVFGLERFHHYVYGRQVTIESDHKPLESITKKSLMSAPPRLMRMLLRIQKYDFKVVYVPGPKIPVADLLSRASIPGEEISDMDVTIHELVNVSQSRLQQIQELAHKDSQLATLMEVVTTGWPSQRKDCPTEVQDFWNYRDEISIHDGILLKGDRVIIPKQMQSEVLDLIHVGHQGIEKCRLRARASVFWCGLNGDIDNLVRTCAACQHNQTSQAKEPLIQIETEQPWTVLGSDIFEWQKDKYLMLVDYYSSFPVVRKLSTTTASNMINNMKAIMSEYGIPDMIISDSGSQYTSTEFHKFSEEYGFEHVTSSPYYHQANGKAEKYVGVVKDAMQKALESGQDADMALLCIRTTPIGHGLPSPAELMFSRKVRSNLPAFSRDPQSCDVEAAKLRKQRSKCKEQYDKQSRTLTTLENGQSVRTQDPITNKWKPAIIRQRCTNQPRAYIVEGESGGQYKRNRRHIRTTGETFNFDRDLDSEHSQADVEQARRRIPFGQETDNNANTSPIVDNPTAQKTFVEGQDVKFGYESNGDDVRVTRSGRVVKPPVKLNL